MMHRWYFDAVHLPTHNLFDVFGILDDLDRKNYRHKPNVIDEEGIKIELPGVKVEDIEITLESKTLKVTGKSRHGKEFTYVYSLKSSIDESSITAKLENGLLSVTLPKKHPECAVRKINIET